MLNEHYGITIESINSFRRYLVEEERAYATVDKYVRDVCAFGKWLDGKLMTKENVLMYKKQLVEVYAVSSVNSVLSSLNSYFVFVNRLELKVKLLKVQKSIFADKSRLLTQAEYERLVDAAYRMKNKRAYYLMQTVCSCGIRVSEIKYITVEALKDRQAVINSKGKTRIVLIPSSLCKALLNYAAENHVKSGAVFVTLKGKPIDRTNVWKIMKSLCEAAAVPKEKVFPHNLRHLFARTYYKQQRDIVRLADILGHSSVNTTRVYTMETGDIHRRQIQSLGLLRL